MVRKTSLSDCSNSTNDDAQDTVSVATSSSSSDSEESTTGSHHDELVLSQQDIVNKDKPGFSNIAVTNSSDIHFGNKTYYQGPVTIKQFLYANPQISNELCEDGKLAIKNDSLVLDSVPDTVIRGKDNPSFVQDAVGIKLKDIEKQINVDATQTQSTEAQKGTRWFRNFSRQQVIAILVAVVLLISLVTLLRVFLTKHQATNPVSNPGSNGDSDEGQSSSPALYPIDPGVNVTLPPKLKIISRREWLAQPAVAEAIPLVPPVPYVFITETATEGCTDQGTCTFHVRYLQSFHIDSLSRDDISYNFMIGGDGFAYEGRGWKSQGAHTYGYNSKSIGIAFVGTFNRTMPSERQIIATKQLLNIGLEKGVLDPDFKLLATRQVDNSNKSPGLALYEDIQKWPHWAEKP